MFSPSVKLNNYKNKGYTGLSNLGNTCFLNSCIQILNHTYELVDFIESEKCKRILKYDNDTAIITRAWAELREIMWANNGIVTPNKFVICVHKLAKLQNREIFTGWAQNDMPEFLLFIIECMHTSISREIKMNINGVAKNGMDKLALQCYSLLNDIYKREYSEIMEIFYGIQVSEIKSLDNMTTYSVKPEHYFILDLHIPQYIRGDVSIYDCLNAYIEPEVMSGDNAYLDESSNTMRDVNKTISFWSFPKVLVITLKRFTHDGTNKLNNLVVFPHNLDLSKYVKGYNPKSYKYELYGVCNHIGGVTGGHYTAFVKNAANEWLHYNDTNVERIDEQHIVTPMAYSLFYRKKNNCL